MQVMLYNNLNVGCHIGAGFILLKGADATGVEDVLADKRTEHLSLQLLLFVESHQFDTQRS